MLTGLSLCSLISMSPYFVFEIKSFRPLPFADMFGFLKKAILTIRWTLIYVQSVSSDRKYFG